MNLNFSRSNRVDIGDVHKATAKVGKDTIEDVEYLVFKHSVFMSSRDKTFKDKIEDFWDAITTPYYVAKRYCKNLYWQIRYGFERMFKGYDSVDTFEIFAKFIERYSKVLKELRNNHMGYPCDLTDEEWNNILDEMLYHLHYMDEQHVIEELEKDVPKEWSPSQKNIDEIMDKHKNEFFKLFSKYFYNLWD